ncbi:uncharacterized protein BX664DRAFT_292830 [Halteromyces radiatus]|uniref:uncharacterized protein n=1 Tax=Halteromyces radiatus TaxID=101107 RepID=UPI00221F7733|nr:uncharacterized protein BX664DRAFT_292830 [Halteromyces radiatus]KAI8097336.1 hypothetical protein BX664DRAFT_292830 [Halteromyces radiatus]
MLPSTLSIRLNQQVHFISFYPDKLLSFEDLVKHVKFSFKDIAISSYDFMMENQVIIYDTPTLHQALKKATKHNRADITLSPKSNQPKINNVPVIKPTVLRWTDNQDSTRHHRSSPQLQQQWRSDDTSSQSSENDGSCIRKDSGISMDEPVKKKQRVTPSIQSTSSSSSSSSSPSRTLTHLSPPPGYCGRSISSPSPPTHSVHPLEMRRPSTAPSSPSYPRIVTTPSPITIKLPALSSITSSPSLDNDVLLHPQLAPLQQSPQRPNYLPAITSPRPSSTPSSTITATQQSTTMINHLPIPSTKDHPFYSHQHYSHRNQQREIHHRQPQLHQNHQQRHHHSHRHHQKLTGQFLCEHVVDPSSGRICGQTFRRSYDLSRHQTIHLKNRPFCYCDQCGKKFTRMDALRRHERVQGHTSKQHLLQQHPLCSPPPPSPSAHHRHHHHHLHHQQQQQQQQQQQHATPTTSTPHTMAFINHRTTQQARV